MNTNHRLPLPAHTVFKRIGLGERHVSAIDALAQVQARDTVMQPFRPLTESLEWELSGLHWQRAGLMPFVENDVPFLVNNSGFLSEHVAAVMFANCAEFAPTESIRVLELGAGMGLFARYFLNAFKLICAQEERDFFDRLIYYVSDQSMQTVQHWRERNQFAAFPAGRVVLGTCDAVQPNIFHSIDGETITLSALKAVVCNYVLDVLPATVVRRAGSGALTEELRVQTHLIDDKNTLAQFTRLTPAEVRALATSQDDAQKSQLIGLLSLLDFETKFFPVAKPDALIDEALQDATAGGRVVVNHGAIACLSASLAVLDASGFIVVSDYGPVQSAQVSDHAMSQRFGPTSALGLNFPLLERYFSARDGVVTTAEGDDERGIHARLFTRKNLPDTIESFCNRFGPAGRDFFEVPCEDARKHIAAGRHGEALDCYRLALSRSPRSWQLTGEVAEFVGLTLQDLAAGREMIRAALEENPWYSPWLWNVLGDILFMEKDNAGAHEAYLQAQKIHPNDVRTNLNLSFTYTELGQFADALAALANALGSDVRGIFRPRLLEKQQQILGALSARWQGEQERLARRAERMMQS